MHTAEHEHIGRSKQQPHHELGVSFGQSVSHKPNGLQMFDHGMEELGLEKMMNGTKLIVKRCEIMMHGNKPF